MAPTAWSSTTRSRRSTSLRERPRADGQWIAFNGWDETDPSNTGLYLASPDLANLRLVLPLPEGALAVEPFGITPDGSQIVFFADTGPEGGTNHAGHNFVVNSDGSGLRQLTPPGSKVGYIGVPTISLSPDGRQAAFGVDNAVWVVDLDGGEARPITDRTGFVWAVSWSPTGEWIAYTRQHGTTSVISLVRPDGTDDKEISATDGTDEAQAGAWSPDGDYLVVRRGAEDRKDLWIMDLEGNFIGQVTERAVELRHVQLGTRRRLLNLAPQAIHSAGRLPHNPSTRVTHWQPSDHSILWCGRPKVPPDVVVFA